MGMKLTGTGNLATILRRVQANVTRAAAAEIHRQGETMRTVSQLNAPVDEGDLEAAHFVETTTRPGGSTTTVGVGGDDVDPYALQMHEGLGPYGSGAFQPGPGTIAKGQQAGGKFLERAFDDQRGEIAPAVADAVRKALT
ncbi:hypothetical protein [Azospirillum sp. SYSU D00513]|uniref:hypothetical protein n=1 Tax=Azospirillum sp. SYSU D00513 TaxID=2812561 RepID=UPI001A965AD6|nr:hypothetical protein [Azospirillum sp. SYSU D00513]